MLIYSEQKNQLCNRLFSLLPPLSYALEKDEKMIVFFFPKPYLEYFPQLAGHPNIRFVFLTKGDFPTGVTKLIHVILNGILKPFAPAGKTFSYRNLKSPKWLLAVRGWKHRHAASYITEQFENIQWLFKPDSVICKKVEKAFQKTSSEIIIGIHIRRGDYIHFKNGKYFYDDAVYILMMEQAAQLFEDPNRQVKFFISSNEPVSETIRSKFPVISIEGLQPISDLYALSQCDYILGPPSTFSQWASFTGKKPLQFIHSPVEIITADKFKVIAAIDSFTNGV